nr:reverse transcriptase domain-containing protein [Tanacetum cinerariifolium]
MIKESVEIFMDDFSVFEDSFDKCLNNLDKILQRCKDAHLVLNWEKCHFMVKERIMLGHKVSSAGLEVDKAKIDVISKIPPLLTSKVLEAFLDMSIFTKTDGEAMINSIQNGDQPLPVIAQVSLARTAHNAPPTLKDPKSGGNGGGGG